MAYNKGLRSLGYDIINLVSRGYSENLHTISKEAENKNVVNYLRGKYKEDMFAFGGDTLPYDIDELNEYFYQLSIYLGENDARRKLGIMKQEDGLLALLAIILNNYVEREEDWNK